MEEQIHKIHVPNAQSKVYKEECSLCFKDQTGEEGVNVCMTCYNCSCHHHGIQHAKKFGHQLALNIKKIPIDDGEEVKSPPKKITKLAIGTEGGADSAKEKEYEQKTKVVFWGDEKKEVKEEGRVLEVVEGILKTEDQSHKEQNKVWEKSIVACEHTLTLQQDQNAPKLERKGLAHCGDCELNNNLWLCMVCGHLGCGRKNYDGTGGNGHAVEHNQKTGHPLVLKMGTITPEGNASIFCYACDEDRKDEELPSHLRFFGIDLSDQVKTEKTTTELELEQNLKFNWLQSAEEGSPVYGPGLTGLVNIGNSCYVSSVVQSLFSIPQFSRYYFDKFEAHSSLCRNDHATCWDCQMGKVAHGLLSGEYSKHPSGKQQNKEVGIPLKMFKKVVCGDSQFDNLQQQDANEFMQFFLQKVQQSEHKNQKNPIEVMEFFSEEKLKCSNCHKVKFQYIKTSELALPMSLHLATPHLEKAPAEESTKDRMAREENSTVPLHASLESLHSSSSAGWKVCQYILFYMLRLICEKCPSCSTVAHALKNFSLASFPHFLVTPVRRFTYDDWVPKKLAVKFGVHLDSVLDLNSLRAKGKQEGEEEMKEKPEAAQEIVINEELVEQLSAMGFPKVQCERAVHFTANSNAEAAMNWLFEHQEDADINEPIQKPKKKESSPQISQELVTQVCELGFNELQAKKALKETGGSVERAVDWLFNHPNETGEEAAVAPSSTPSHSEKAFQIDTKTDPKYKLLGFILHKGNSIQSGHYVAYLKKEGKWICFDDTRVQESANPPVQSAYIYIWEKI